MSVIAKLRYLRIAPRKVRLVADLIRGKPAQEAKTILNFQIKRASRPILKLLESAISNAKNNFRLEESNLYVSKILVDEGPKYKRWMPRARGVAAEIQKKASHVTIVLEEIEKKAKKAKKIEETPKPEEVKEVKEKVAEVERPSKEDKLPTGQAKLRPESEIRKPEKEKGIRRIFRRKAF